MSVAIVLEEGRRVIGPFPDGLLMDDCSVWPARLGRDHSIAEMAYQDGPRGERRGWALRGVYDTGELYPTLFIGDWDDWSGE